MVTLRQGEKRDIAVKVLWAPGRGSGAISLTTPERRILDKNRAVVATFDWAGTTWDSSKNELYALFDSTAAGLTAAAIYHMQLRGVIGNERYLAEVLVNLVAV